MKLLSPATPDLSGDPVAAIFQHYAATKAVVFDDLSRYTAGFPNAESTDDLPYKRALLLRYPYEILLSVANRKKTNWSNPGFVDSVMLPQSR